MVEVTINRGGTWEMVSAIANIGLLVAAVVAAVFAFRDFQFSKNRAREEAAAIRAEMEAAERRHHEVLHASARPYFVLQSVQFSRDSSVLSGALAHNIGTGPGTGVRARVWLHDMAGPGLRIADDLRDEVERLRRAARSGDLGPPHLVAMTQDFAANERRSVPLHVAASGLSVVSADATRQLLAVWVAEFRDLFEQELATHDVTQVTDLEGRVLSGLRVSIAPTASDPQANLPR